MNILFIHPEKFLNIGIPSGIATLGAILKARGHNVRVFDTTLMKPVPEQGVHVLSINGADDNISAGDEATGASHPSAIKEKTCISKHPLLWKISSKMIPK